ncbi:hypothetical protein BC829DRAFT_418453 [Chytridium lagenaria]|nr:hypothetical protein BC829DRAFT_418453 [Chytridium lagenaria]
MKRNKLRVSKESRMSKSRRRMTVLLDGEIVERLNLTNDELMANRRRLEERNRSILVDLEGISHPTRQAVGAANRYRRQHQNLFSPDGINYDEAVTLGDVDLSRHYNEEIEASNWMGTREEELEEVNENEGEEDDDGSHHEWIYFENSVHRIIIPSLQKEIRADKKRAFLQLFENLHRGFGVHTLDLAVKCRNKGMSYQAICEVMFTSNDGEFDDYRSELYPKFLQAIYQFTELHHLVWHGRFLPDVIERHGHGRTVCPCTGSSQKTVGIVVRMVDGYFSAKKVNIESGGGGDYGTSSLAASFFTRTTEDTATPATQDEVECTSRFTAGQTTYHERNGKKLDRAGIFVSFCRHEVSHHIIGM